MPLMRILIRKLMPKGNPLCEHRRVLTEEDVALIRQCKAHRNKLLKEAAELTDGKLAEKFECDKKTIWKVKVDSTTAHYINHEDKHYG